MEEIQDHVPGGANLRQDHFNRVSRTLLRFHQRRVAEPFGERLAAPLGRRFNLLQLLGGESSGYGLGAENRPCPCSSVRLSIEIVAVRVVLMGARLWANPSLTATGRQGRSSALSRERLLNQHVYAVSAIAASA